MTDFSEDIDNCLDILHKGGIILYPTDTIWGLGCDATNEAAVNRIYELKQRPQAKSMIVLVADERHVLKYVTQPDLRVFDYLKGVSKPTTVIYKGATGLAETAIAHDGTVAMRVVHDVFCKTLIKRFRKPLVSTSANISGEPAPADFDGISDTIRNGVDYIVNYRQKDVISAVPSAIISWNADGTVSTIRQ